MVRKHLDAAVVAGLLSSPGLPPLALALGDPSALTALNATALGAALRAANANVAAVQVPPPLPPPASLILEPKPPTRHLPLSLTLFPYS